MKRAGAARSGAMAAILGLDDVQLVSICQQAGAVQVANFNAPGQIVISGEKDALERAVALAKEAGAKRSITLAVSIAAHSELMQPAVADFMQPARAVPLQAAQIPVIANVNALPLEDVEAMRAEMLAQLTASVQWVKSVEFMVARGVNEFIEIGPKDVLAGLIRRITKDATARSIGNLTSINTLLQGAPA
jgi:[acyl-carrier-protein] S-malonyltransferase